MQNAAAAWWETCAHTHQQQQHLTDFMCIFKTGWMLFSDLQAPHIHSYMCIFLLFDIFFLFYDGYTEYIGHFSQIQEEKKTTKSCWLINRWKKLWTNRFENNKNECGYCFICVVSTFHWFCEFFFHHIFSPVPWIILAPKVERLHKMEVNIFIYLFIIIAFFFFSSIEMGESKWFHTFSAQLTQIEGLWFEKCLSDLIWTFIQ